MLEIHGIKTLEKKQESKIKQCPRCEHINPKEHLFCKNCGSILDMKTAVDLDEFTQVLGARGPIEDINFIENGEYSQKALNCGELIHSRKIGSINPDKDSVPL